MYCKKCGKEQPDGTKFCSECGTNQEDGASVEASYQRASFEFKTVQCYPSSYEENRYKEFYEGCGWTIMDMDRRQVYTGQSSDGTKYYSTSTHIKLQRDKNHPNYAKIAELSSSIEYGFENLATDYKKSDAYQKASSAFAVFVTFSVMPIFWIIPPFIIGWILLAIKYSKKRKELKISVQKTIDEYNEKKNRILNELKELL